MSMTILQETDYPTGTAVSATTHTINHPIVDGTDRATVVRLAVPGSGGNTITSVTLDPSGINQSLVRQATMDAGVSGKPLSEIWTLPETDHPAAGTYPIVVVLSAPRVLEANVQTYESVDQTGVGTDSGLSAPTPTKGTGGSPSITVPATVGGVVLDCLSVYSASAITIAQGSGQVLDHSATASGTGSGFSHADGDTSVAMGWTLTGQINWALTAIALAPAVTNAAPTVEITTPPASVGPVPAGTKIVVEFTASDAEDGDVTDSAGVTSSNTDDGTSGALGTGSPLTIDTTDWADGARTITVTATDSGGTADSASFVLNIGTAATGFDKARFIIHALGGIL